MRSRAFQIDLPVLPALTKVGADNRKAKDVMVEMESLILVGTDDGYVVDCVQNHVSILV